MDFAEALAAIEAAWSLQAAGFKVVAFCRAGNRPALRHVRGLEICDVPNPELDATGTVVAVRTLCGTLTPTALLPLDDKASVFPSRRRKFCTTRPGQPRCPLPCHGQACAGAI